MKMLLGLTQPTAGSMTIMDTPVSPATRGKLLPHIGSMIEAPPGYGHLTGEEATPKVIAHLVSHQVHLYEVRRAQQRLEDIFMGLTGRGGML